MTGDQILIESPSLRQSVSVDLGGTTYVLALAWLPRLETWNVQVLTESGEALTGSRPLEPGCLSVIPDRTQAGAPAGLLVVEGNGPQSESALVDEDITITYVAAS